MNNTTSYIYLIQDGEYINTDVYKIGRTTQNGDTRSLNRLRCYSANTVQVYLRKVDTEHVVEIEKDIISVFKLKYILVKGVEWFNGNKQQMIGDINTIIDKKGVTNTVETVTKVTKRSKPVIKIKDIDTTKIQETVVIEESELVTIPKEVVTQDTDTNSVFSENNIIDDTFCERCGMIFKCKKYLLQHLQKEAECVCLYSDITRLEMMNKLRERTGIECEKCKRIYKNKETVRKHNCKGCNFSLIQKTIN